jgi:parvulin-like peptidyl-prolyl isomerase
MRSVTGNARATIARVVSAGRTRKIATILAALAMTAGLAACAGSGGDATLGPDSDVAIQIGAQKITNGEIERRALFLATVPTGSTPTEPPAKDSKEFREFRLQAAEQLRDERVFGILAAQCGALCKVTDAAVNSDVKDIVDQQFNGVRADLVEALGQRGITLADLEASLLAAKQEERLSIRVEQKVAYTEAEALAYYRKNLVQYKLAAEKRLSHILVATKAEAAAIRAQATRANFAQLAREKSQDIAAASSGGDLGPVTSTALLPEISQAAQKLKAGQISQPVQSQFGWHLLLLRDIKARTKTFDEVKAQIVMQELEVKRAAAVQKWRDTVVKKQQDRAKYLNSKVAPAAPATTTTAASTTSAGTATGKTTATTTAPASTGGTTVTAPTVSVTPTSTSGPATP